MGEEYSTTYQKKKRFGLKILKIRLKGAGGGGASVDLLSFVTEFLQQLTVNY
jgi:hypothetical protein